MPQAAQLPVFTSRPPQVLNSQNTVSFSLPILNTGSEPASNVFITGIQLGQAVRMAPANLPVFAGALTPGNLISANARFSTHGLTAGNTYLAAVQGIYESQGKTYAFQVNRFIVIPAPAAPLATLLEAHVNVSIAAGLWSYTVVNDEAAGSPNFISALHLDIVAPISATGAPAGWQVITDNASYVLWYASDQQAPYTSQIAPGAQLTGFAMQSARTTAESRGFAIASWNHQTSQAGLVTMGAVAVPSRSG